MKNTKARIYLDNNATTVLSAPVISRINELSKLALNPSSIHQDGRYARKLVEEAKRSICSVLNINQKDYHIVFTSSGTEANNWVINGLINKKFIVSSIEHISILNPAINVGATIIPVDENGLIQLSELEKALKVTENALVSVIYANNETGVIQNLEQVIEIARKYKAIVHSDMIQAIGKVRLDFNKLDLDLFTIASHKIGGPQGISALFIKKGLDIKPMLVGGGQNQGLRAGTENVIGICGMAVAIEEAILNISHFISHCTALREYLEGQISMDHQEVKFVSKHASRLPNTSMIIMPNISNEAQLIKFDMEGISLSAGSACSSGKITVSHVLKACGMSDEEAKSAIRVSLSQDNTENEIKRFLFVWKNLYKELK